MKWVMFDSVLLGELPIAAIVPALVPEEPRDLVVTPLQLGKLRPKIQNYLLYLRECLAITRTEALLEFIQGQIGLLLSGALVFLVEIIRHARARWTKSHPDRLPAPRTFDEQDRAVEVVAQHVADRELRTDAIGARAEPWLEFGPGDLPLAVLVVVPDVIALDPRFSSF